MASKTNTLVIPCVIYNEGKGKCKARIPDLHMDIYGSTFVEVIAESILTATAVITYKKDRNVHVNIESTYEGLLKETSNDKTPHFIHVLTISAEV